MSASRETAGLHGAGPSDLAASFKPEPEAAARRQAAQKAQRRSKLRAALGAVARTLAAISLSAALSAGAWQGFRWATTSPYFSVREIRFSGLAHAGEDELLRRSGLALGQNLFHADLSRAARAIEAHPWVASARLERRLPATIVASVVEHQPRAQVQLGQLAQPGRPVQQGQPGARSQLYILDSQAQLFKRATANDALDLPLVTGLGRDEWLDHRSQTSVRLLNVLQLLDAWTAARLPIASLSEVRLDDDAGMTLFARDLALDDASGRGDPQSVQEIHLGTQGFAVKLQKLLQVRAALARRSERAARIDLDNQARPEWVAAQLTQPR